MVGWGVVLFYKFIIVIFVCVRIFLHTDNYVIL